MTPAAKVVLLLSRCGAPNWLLAWAYKVVAQLMLLYVVLRLP